MLLILRLLLMKSLNRVKLMRTIQKLILVVTMAIIVAYVALAQTTTYTAIIGGINIVENPGIQSVPSSYNVSSRVYVGFMENYYGIGNRDVKYAVVPIEFNVSQPAQIQNSIAIQIRDYAKDTWNISVSHVMQPAYVRQSV